MAERKPITVGARFGRLIVLGNDPISDPRHYKVICKCDCGETGSFLEARLRCGKTKSCGCLSRELTIVRSTKHGACGTKIHRAWMEMLKRCTNKNTKNWCNYGGRGIAVCERWHQFENFLADMGAPPLGASIDRIDNNGNYEPGNCRWATWTEQQRNKRSNRPVTAFGQTKTIVEWSLQTGIPRTTIWNRLNRGISPEIAVTAKRYQIQT